MLRCPSPIHEDASPSASLYVSARDGKQRWFCHVCGIGGDELDLVRVAYDLQTNTEAARVLRKGMLGPVLGKDGRPVMKSSNGASPSHDTPPREIVATYDYTDAEGKLLYQVVRFEPKDFAVRRPTPQGRTWGRGEVTPVLYRLPEVLRAETVWITEGEKDADRLRERGCCTTTSPGGAGKWMDDYSLALRGKRVFVVADNDLAGRRHSVSVSRSLRGIARSVRIVYPALGKDVSEHLEQGGRITPYGLLPA